MCSFWSKLTFSPSLNSNQNRFPDTFLHHTVPCLPVCSHLMTHHLWFWSFINAYSALKQKILSGDNKRMTIQKCTYSWVSIEKNTKNYLGWVDTRGLALNFFLLISSLPLDLASFGLFLLACFKPFKEELLGQRIYSEMRKDETRMGKKLTFNIKETPYF